MESWNQTNGHSPYYPQTIPSPSPLSAGHQGSEPRLASYSSSQSSTPLSYSNSNVGPYTNALSIDRSPSNASSNGNSGQVLPQWNPAALLNPKGFNQLTKQNTYGMSNARMGQNSSNGFSNGNTPAPQLSFQFDSPAAEPDFQFDSSQSHAHPTLRYSTSNQIPNDNSNGSTAYANSSENQIPHKLNGNTNGFAAYANGSGYNIGEARGMGSMLERIHNIADRDMIPQKRRKICSGQEEGKNTAGFNGGGKSSILGQYVKDKREEARKEARSHGTAPVDLTALDENDDDVVIVGDSGDKEVCYGRIEGAELSAHKVPTPKPSSVSTSDNYWPPVKILLRRRVGDRTQIIHAVDSTREIIGCLDVNTAIGLAPLLDSKFCMRTAARLLMRVKREGDLPPGTPTSCRYGLDLNLYGPKKYALQVGRHLSQKQIYLRTPLFVESGVELHNPHAIEKPPQPPPRTMYSTGYGSRPQAPQRTTEEIRNDILGMFDSLERSENLPEMEPDSRITTELLKHQKQGLYFMTHKEKERVFDSKEAGNSSLWRLIVGPQGQRSYYNVITGQEERQSPPQVLGGILADMMGLGKTLSVLSLIVQTLDNEANDWAKLTPQPTDDYRDLCPTRKGKTALPKIEPTPLVRNSKATLLVSPLSTIANWEEQIKQHIKLGTLKYYIYHGANRIKCSKRLSEYDLVITTYGSVASEFNHRSKKKQGIYPLEEINWFRIVLDEAHMIREQSTQQSKAICRLAAQRRWAVTGTPVQNRLEDLGALMTFLRIKPFDEKGGFAQYIMGPFKMCDPEILPKLRLLVDSITLRRLKDRIDLPARHDHLVKLDFSAEERIIYDIFAKNANDRVKVITGRSEKSLGGKSYVHILQSILRLRLICAHGRDLLGEEDMKVMSGLSKDSAIELDDDEEDNSPGLSSQQAYDMYNLMKETNADVCLACGHKIGPNDVADSDTEPKDEIIGYLTPCYHLFCNTCIVGYKTQMEYTAQGQSQAGCHFCQQWIKLSYFALRQGGVDEEEVSRLKAKGHARHGKDIENYSGPHTKTKALIHDLLQNNVESELIPDQPPIKSVVFSGWTAHLDLIQLALNENNIKYTRLDGKMSRTARGAALDSFREDPSILVILVSISAGGLGLNLTTANKVYVMEPQYNPAAEAQAVDRVHRLGQKREVETVRYVMNDSFEEKMLELQDKKKKLASLSMDSDSKATRMDKAEAARKRLEDLRSLFK